MSDLWSAFTHSRTLGVGCPRSLPHFEPTVARPAANSWFRKHSLRHQKLHRCRVANCARTEGFTTTNDRDRHEKSVHKTPGVYFRCMDENCASYTKTFARRDNLKDHLKRMHKFPAHMDEAEANERRNELADSWKVDILAVPTDNETPSLRIMS